MYTIEYDKRFLKEIRKLDQSVQVVVKSWITKHLEECENPRKTGKSLTGNKSGFWRYRIGDYRLIVEIQDSKLVIVAISIGHRSRIYKA